MNDRLIGRQAIADYLKRSVSTVDRWMRSGYLPTYRVGTTIEASITELNAWIRANRNGGQR